MSDGRMRLAVALVVVVAVGVPAAPTPAATSPPVAVSVSSGGHHTCSLVASGGVKCWGNNYYGELGDGTGKDSKTPVGVSRLPSGATAISAGYGHACALTPGGGVKCWGENGSGQLGDGTTASYREAPVDVSGLSGEATAIAAGGWHTCAMVAAGGVKCWGNNTYGQLGDGTRTNRYAPVEVSGLSSGVASISAGRYHTCALMVTGGVKCWGRNVEGQLGSGGAKRWRTTPAGVTGLTSGVAEVSAGGWHTCALLRLGGLGCWGANSYGQVGDGTTTRRRVPTRVSGLWGGVAAVSAGSWHTCALMDMGGVMCWGNNAYGRLGDGTTTERHAPVDVSHLSSGAATISAGTAHTCALMDVGGVMCWGYNAYGQLGDGSRQNRLTPVDVHFR